MPSGFESPSAQHRLPEDQVDAAVQPLRSVSDSTQTEDEDSVDSAIVVAHGNGYASQVVDGVSGSKDPSENEGFFSHLMTMVLPSRSKCNSFEEEQILRDCRTISTQTVEQDPICARGQQLSYLIIQDLALRKTIPSSVKDDVYESLRCCVCEILDKHSILFHGMVRRFEVNRYHVFSTVADELFEANSTNESGQLRITWGRIVSLYAFAVRLALEYSQNLERVDAVTRFLAAYITKHVVPFVHSEGGWEGLVEQFPVPDDEDKQFRRAVMWSGLCLGLVATMYVSSLIHK